MPRGGARPGAGRKPGGERAKPPGPIEVARAEVRRVLTTSESPLAILTEIAANPDVDISLRVQAAIGVAPYLYPRLSASIVANASDKVDRPTTKALVDRLATAFGRLAQQDPAPKLIEAEVIEGEAGGQS